MEPVTTVGLSAIAAYLAKDGVTKLLGPTADYLGGGLKDLTQRRIENIRKVFSNASKKLGGQLEEPGQVPPRILKTVINEASYCEDPLVLEYFGEVLASSRTESGRDDQSRGQSFCISNQDTLSPVFGNCDSFFVFWKRFGTSKNRRQLQVFLPFQGYADSMMFSQEEWGNPQLLDHIWHGLFSGDLIEGEWRFGPPETLKGIFASASSHGIVCTPSALGAKIFLWVFGCSNSPLEHIFSGAIDVAVEDLPKIVPGAIATRDQK
ncbi:MAG: hypothetical protein OXK72_03265 [Gammaproteobacteria bacterium]|nr:hypothetical protein [Gammaproteobacteria bacterium]MDE0411073.1 hypothetical protein [Gammaproteobacteria bacterium]